MVMPAAEKGYQASKRGEAKIQHASRPLMDTSPPPSGSEPVVEDSDADMQANASDPYLTIVLPSQEQQAAQGEEALRQRRMVFG